MDDRIIALSKQRYMKLTTYRRDGRAVSTPVWFALDGARVLIWTDRASGKAKRVRANGRASVGASDARGKLTGPMWDATARVLPASGDARALQLLSAKYRLMKPLVGLWSRLGLIIQHKQRPVEIFLELTLI